MKTIFILTAILFSTGVWAQQQFEVSTEPDGTKILKGIISKDLVSRDSSFKWFAENKNGYTPNASAIEAFKKFGKDIQIVAFAGTWCHDTHFVLPKFFSLIDAAGFSTDKVTLIGVDRSKKTLSHLVEAFNVIDVPTFIVMKDGKELGRVVEYGKYGMWDKELGEVIITAGNLNKEIK